MALCGPDFSDSDDSALSDDCDYDKFKEQVKEINAQRLKSQITTQHDNEGQQLRFLYTALSSGNVEDVVKYIDDGIKVNVDVEDGWTPLLLAASFGNPDLVKALLEKGADVNSVRDGCTALMMACNTPDATSPFEKSVDVIKRLVENGADVKAINRKRMTALMFAASSGNLEAVEYLLPLSDKNAEDNQRWTALFWAVSSNQPVVTKYLLGEGFEYENCDIRDNTPLDYAKKFNFTEIIPLFPTNEADVISTIIDTHSYSFEETFAGLKPGEKPKFLLDICNILCGVRAEATIKILSEKHIDLYNFLSTSDAELKTLGVHLPYQRNRILGGLYRFHKHPFNPRSLHCVPLDEIYSNIDMATQLLATIKQVIVMEASLAYTMKHYKDQVVARKELPLMVKYIQEARKKIINCKAVLSRLRVKIEQMDYEVQPADLITSNSKTCFLPWRKIIFSISVLSLVVVFKVFK